MTGDLGQHVIEKRYAGLDAVRSRAIKVQGQLDRRLVGCPFDVRGTGHSNLHQGIQKSKVQCLWLPTHQTLSDFIRSEQYAAIRF